MIMYVQKSNPFKKVAKTKAKGGGTRKVCLPKAKIASMSQAERQKVIRAKQAAGKAGKYKRSSKSNVTGTSRAIIKDGSVRKFGTKGRRNKK